MDDADATRPPARSVDIARTVATILSPVAVGLASVAWLWSQNRAEFGATVMVRPGLVVAGLALGLLLVYRWLSGRLGAASLLASVTMVAILGFGTVADVVDALTGRDSARVQTVLRIVDLVVLIAFVVLVVALARRGRSFGRAARFAGFLGVVVIALALARPFGASTDVSLGLDGAGPGLADDGDGAAAPVDGAIPAPRPAPELADDDAAHPDVYDIVLDGYGRADMLARHYGFDDGPFLDALRERGFFVAERSTSNYPYTYLSLASSLNGRYLTDDIARDEPYATYLDLIRSAAVPQAYRERGYRYDLIRTAWAGTSGSSIADEAFGPVPLVDNEFEAALISQSLVGGLVPQPSIADYHLAAFDALETIAADPRPTFTLGHIVAPHPPYVLDRDGTVVLDTAALRGQWGSAANEQGYLEQVRFVNDRVLAAIDRILATSTTRPIIILQGDHGTWSSRFEPGVAPHDVEAERMSILNAYLVPDAVRADLTPDITPVDTFRIIDRVLFGTSTTPLPVERWYGEGGPPSNLVPYRPAD